jgi:hypothetical protein
MKGHRLLDSMFCFQGSRHLKEGVTAGTYPSGVVHFNTPSRFTGF